MQTYDDIPLSAFIGDPIAKTNIKLQGEGKQPALVPIALNWKQYVKPNDVKGTAVDLNGVLDCILSMFVDNKGFPYGVIIVFPDTDATFYCGPDSQVMIPVLTAGLKVQFYLDTTSLDISRLPLYKAITQVYFCNTATFPNNFDINQQDVTRPMRTLFCQSFIIADTSQKAIFLPGQVNYIKSFRFSQGGYRPTAANATGAIAYRLTIGDAFQPLWTWIGRFYNSLAQYVHFPACEVVDLSTTVESSVLYLKVDDFSGMNAHAVSLSLTGYAIQ